MKKERSILGKTGRSFFIIKLYDNLYLNLNYKDIISLYNRKTPEDGFEPPLKEPESSVLPLDDSGKFSIIYSKNVSS